VNQISKAVPAPTPQDIEAALIDIRNGANVYGWWIRFTNYLKNEDEAKAQADRLWWVDIIDHEGFEETACGGGVTLAEAAAVAWINTCVCAWWSQPGFSDSDDAKVPRHIPRDWRFELYSGPVGSPFYRP
jgi:hypothetical protein